MSEAPKEIPRIKVCGLTNIPDMNLAASQGADYAGFIFAGGTPRFLEKKEARPVLENLTEKYQGKPEPVGVFLNETSDEILELAETLNLRLVQLHGKSLGLFFNEDFRNTPVRGKKLHIIPAIGIGEDENLDQLERVIQFLTKHNVQKESPGIPHILVDTAVKGQSGGTGKLFRHKLIFPYLDQANIMIAGGLNADNIQTVLEAFNQAGRYPFGFDLSSGLEEKPRIKSHSKTKQFFQNWKKYFS